MFRVRSALKRTIKRWTGRRTPNLDSVTAPPVCVIIHAFYVDDLDQLLQALKPVAQIGLIGISVTSTDDALEAGRAIDRVWGSAMARDIRIVPNRGRNFAPLLCTFAEVVRDHVLVLHVHTKRSSYTGSTQSDWLQHMLVALTTAQAIDRIATDPNIGLLMPSRWPGLSVWAQHWLQNQRHGRTIYQGIGLDPALVTGYVDYPVGGMFWAKTAALMPLYNSGLSVEDFEAESGQIDGTLAHAIERCIPASAAVAGFSFLEFDPAANTYTMDTSHRLGQPMAPPIEQVAGQLADAELVSIDLFDTINFRPTLDPSALQYFAARSASATTELAQQLLAIRVQSEGQLRNLPNRGDLTIDEIYAYATSLHPQLQQSLATMRAEEFHIERRAFTPNQPLIDLLNANRPGVEMILMTDTTLNNQEIHELVALATLDASIDRCFISSQVAARKDNGTMWDMVASQLNPAPGRWLHIGDNEVSDIQAAGDRGVRAAHVASPRGAFDYQSSIPSTRWIGQPASSAAAGLSACALYAHQVGRRHLPDDAHRFGYAAFGPMVWAYLTHLVQVTAKSATNHVLFAARDCFTIERALRAAEQVHNRTPLQGSYFRVSRTAAIGAAQGAGFRPELIVDSGTYVGPFNEMVLARTGVATPNDDRYRQHIHSIADRELCLELLQTIQQSIVTNGQRNLAGLQRYLLELGIADSTDLTIADLGYSGTAQRALSACLPNHIVGVYAATMESAQLAIADGCDVAGYFATNYADHGQAKHLRSVFLLRNDWLAEALLSEQCGTFLSYADDPRQAALLGPAATPENSLPAIHRAQQGVVDFCIDMATIYGPHALDEPVNAPLIDAYLSEYPFSMLPPAETLFAGLRLDVGFNDCNQQSTPVF